ncbi:MAG: bile acid:sodium symporter [Alkalispirochaetaceae bacterium]
MPILRHWFLIGLLMVVVVALSVGGNLDQAGWGEAVRNASVFLIFLATGYSLDSRRILADIGVVHHHLGLQLFIFGITPLIILLPAALIGGRLTGPTVWVGLVGVAVLPTTISSCIAFTQVAGGNVSLSMLNSALSNAAGILISPLLLSLLIGLSPEAGAGAGAVEAGTRFLGREATLSIFFDLASLMLAPAALGQAVRILLLRRGVTSKKRGTEKPQDAPGAQWVRTFNSVLILLIVFLTLSSASADRGLLTTATRFLPVFGYLALVHLAVLAAAAVTAGVLMREKRDRVAFLFTGSQKTLAFGAPMLTLYFASNPGQLTGAMLPLIFYHLWQLVTAGVVESFYRVKE